MVAAAMREGRVGDMIRKTPGAGWSWESLRSAQLRGSWQRRKVPQRPRLGCLANVDEGASKNR